MSNILTTRLTMQQKVWLICVLHYSVSPSDQQRLVIFVDFTGMLDTFFVPEVGCSSGETQEKCGLNFLFFVRLGSVCS